MLKSQWWGNDSNSQKGKQIFLITDHNWWSSTIIDGTDAMKSLCICVDILARLGEYMGIIVPGRADRTNQEGKNICHYDHGVNVDTDIGLSLFRQEDII